MSDADKKALSPEAVAHDLYDQAVAQVGGNAQEASIRVMQFLTDALVYSVGMSAGGDEQLLRQLLEHLASMIAAAPTHPIVAAVTAEREARRKDLSS